ncbi:MAG TPA: zf-HC2 domain-containing protein [Candidatus Binataceae bacterium]|nr:zf-HC2 domain-containing protein [Candidatus Binataceae bacterium]
MNCREYIEQFLSAHADGELAGSELREAQKHVVSCEDCAIRLAQERELKAMVRRHAAQMQTPPAIRERLFARLAGEPERFTDGSPAIPSSRERVVRTLRRPAVWIPISIAAGLAFAIVTARSLGFLPSDSVQVVYHNGGVPEFDVAIAHYEKFTHHFNPNVPSGSYGDVAGAYLDAHMPGYMWNFNGSGLTLVGGRLDKLPDGRPVTYTFYKGDGRSILCTRYKLYDLTPPAGAMQMIEGHQIYSYYGYSICYSYSRIGNFACLLITRQPIEKLLDSIEYASD